MDDVEAARFSREALSSSPPGRHLRDAFRGPLESGRGRVEDGREEQPLGPADDPRSVRVRGLDEAERTRVLQEAQLLAALEVAGVGAAPTVLELEEDGYVRETAPALVRRTGRRVAGAATPPTGERRALADARESLDALIDALHERGWVLGAPEGRGVGARDDGSVLVLALDGLRREESLSARQQDRRWVDSVLQDQDRTLRRRVHLEPPGTAVGRRALGIEPADEHPAPPPAPAHLPERNRPAARHAGRTAPAPGRPAALAVVRDVLGQPRLRRIALLSGALVLLVGIVGALGMGWWRSPAAPEHGGQHPVASAPSHSASRPAPAIEEPQVLVAELAGARHAFVTGMSDRPASAPGSESLAEDERVRAAYGGISVRSGGPVVHSAEVVRQPDAEGIAELHAVTSMQELRLEERDGTMTTIPATEAVAVRLVLEWDGEQWLLVEVAPRPAEGSSDGT